MRLTRFLIAFPLLCFLLLFLVFPLLGLCLAAFLGYPAPIVDWLVNLRFAALVQACSEQASLRYIAEFFSTPRYYKGLINSVGLAPMVCVNVFALGLAGQKLTTRANRWFKWVKGPGVVLTFGLVCSGAATRPLWAVEGGLFESILGASTMSGRLLQACGYTSLVTLASTALGVGVAVCLHRGSFPLKRLFGILVIVPLSTPPFLGALAFKNLLGEFGMVTRALHSVGLAHPFSGQSTLAAGFVESFLFFPFVCLTTMAALERFDEGIPEASRVLGGSKVYGFFTATLPTLLPGILAGAFLVFIRSFGDFATLKLLLPIQYSVIVVEAYRDLSGNAYWGGAAMLSGVMISVILVLLALQKYVVEGGSFQTVTGRGGAKSREALPRNWQDWMAFSFCSAVFFVPLSFLASTFLVSVSRNWGAELYPTQFTLGRYSEIWAKFLSEDESPLVNSFSLTPPALIGCVVMGFCVAFLISRTQGWKSQALDFVTVLAFVIPGVAFAIALIGVFNDKPMELHRTPFLVVAAYIVTRAPYAIRTTLASFQQIGVSMEESSRTLGGGELLTLSRVTVPLVLPGILAGAVMVFISAMQDVAITLMIAPPDWYPCSVQVFRFIEHGRIYDASAYGIVLFFLIVIPYSALFLSKRGVRAGL